MSLNPPTQYVTDANLRACQRLWEHQQPPFDLVSWVLELPGLRSRSTGRVLDVGCGNGAYLTQLRARDIDAVGCDLSSGMLSAAAAPDAKLVNADVARLPFTESAFDAVLAPHMLYHVSDRQTAASELRRVLCPGGRCEIVTNGIDHMQALRSRVESAVRLATPGWGCGIRLPVPGPKVVEDVRRSVQLTIDDSGAFIVRGSTGAFVCE